MASASVFRGVLTALVTPMNPDGSVDEAAFRSLVRRQLDAGIHGLVPCGTTGEAPTLTVDEQVALVQWTLEEAAGAVPVLAGIGSNDTQKAITMGRKVQALGVQGVLATAPYYNKPTQEGLFQHFSAIADALDVEVCVYDVPGRSVVKVQPATLARLAVHPQICSVKDATGDLFNAVENRRLCGSSFGLLSGDDFTLLPFWAVGGHGCISVLSNVMPGRVVSLFGDAQTGITEAVRDDFVSMMPLVKALFVESNPVPVKAALASLGLCRPYVRLPLVPLSTGAEEVLQSALLGCDIR